MMAITPKEILEKVILGVYGEEKWKELEGLLGEDVSDDRQTQSIRAFFLTREWEIAEDEKFKKCLPITYAYITNLSTPPYTHDGLEYSLNKKDRSVSITWGTKTLKCAFKDNANCEKIKRLFTSESKSNWRYRPEIKQYRYYYFSELDHLLTYLIMKILFQGNEDLFRVKEFGLYLTMAEASMLSLQQETSNESSWLKEQVDELNLLEEKNSDIEARKEEIKQELKTKFLTIP